MSTGHLDPHRLVAVTRQRRSQSTQSRMSFHKPKPGRLKGRPLCVDFGPLVFDLLLSVRTKPSLCLEVFDSRGVGDFTTPVGTHATRRPARRDRGVPQHRLCAERSRVTRRGPQFGKRLPHELADAFSGDFSHSTLGTPNPGRIALILGRLSRHFEHSSRDASRHGERTEADDRNAALPLRQWPGSDRRGQQWQWSWSPPSSTSGADMFCFSSHSYTATLPALVVQEGGA